MTSWPWWVVQADGDLVAHGAGGNEEAGLASEDLRGPLFEQVDGRVFAVDVVAHPGPRPWLRASGQSAGSPCRYAGQ